MISLIDLMESILMISSSKSGHASLFEMLSESLCTCAEPVNSYKQITSRKDMHALLSQYVKYKTYLFNICKNFKYTRDIDI